MIYGWQVEFIDGSIGNWNYVLQNNWIWNWFYNCSCGDCVSVCWGLIMVVVLVVVKIMVVLFESAGYINDEWDNINYNDNINWNNG